MPTCISVTGTVWVNLCSLEQQNPQSYPDESEHLTPWNQNFPVAFLSLKFSKSNDRAVSADKNVYLSSKTRRFRTFNVCLIRWLGSEQIGCFTATALTEQGSWSVPVLRAGKLGHPSTKLLEGGSQEQSLQRVPAP